MARCTVVTILRLRPTREGCLERLVGGALVDHVYRGDELVDRVSVVHAISFSHLGSIFSPEFIPRR